MTPIKPSPHRERQSKMIETPIINIDIIVAHDYIKIQERDNVVLIGIDTARCICEHLLELDYLKEEHTKTYAKIPEAVKIVDYKTKWVHILNQI